ncbi:hypothetical protein NCAS_0A10890 [Naumovozyma castellii]|uniref:Uncharacterized protein n=1 Tax=Naumovozyma castellii TaxID=27288 RepID=G0V849_NAUCA|nr:hypothetical protein NCAS_0A10890 [Naumovozyma castellii CBS 4309]CCC67647.1 hypothetical protein NCAS_0A10890 [Naumovozyma castellii CBS 4309]
MNNNKFTFSTTQTSTNNYNNNDPHTNNNNMTFHNFNSTPNEIINTLGVSKRMGNKVLNELDSRTHQKFEQLKDNDDTNATHESSSSSSFQQLFNTKHNVQFNHMQSIGNQPTTPKKNIHSYTPDNGNIHDNTVSESMKRMKTNDSQSRIKRRSITPATPVSEITRRIRRLRLRASIAPKVDDSITSSTSIRNTPLTGGNPITMMNPPTFLKPTINSLNKRTIKRSEPIHSNLNRNVTTSDASNIRQERTRRDNSKQETTVVVNSNVKPRTSQLKKSTTMSVFDRLYSTATPKTSISRSTSMNTIQSGEPSSSNVHSRRVHSDTANTITDKSMSHNASTSKIKFGRSKTSGSLSSNLNNGSDAGQEVRRPLWR